ncbi:hypothetical protein GCM10011365_21610 [Marinicella pacifica]|uniref:Uncharacterized protein n=1 Tax=Marinicella pacifica TaxID=1171543 RepID=A0A917CYM6_9GAMM|nr:hypothetical protein GCM10011365_21610 [Marinicella pacifica]
MRIGELGAGAQAYASMDGGVLREPGAEAYASMDGGVLRELGAEVYAPRTFFLELSFAGAGCYNCALLN